LRTEIVTVTLIIWFSGTIDTPDGSASGTWAVKVAVLSERSIGAVRATPPITLIALPSPVKPTDSGATTYDSKM
jgi:hypothetical protein